ncbi:MAG: hypothetical protein SVM86_07215 [Candidatus Cloacimonadota bacterium]|nr:hypothetical protein [Candidatus Cloacimonadota bacterium]
MMETYNPYLFIRQTQRKKFRELLYPILIVVFSFILSYFFQTDVLIIISLAGFIWYIYISIRYRVHQTLPVQDKKNIILAPLNSRVVKISEHHIVLKKKWYYNCEIRNPANFPINYNINSSKTIFYEKNSNILGKFIGIVPVKATCRIEIPQDFEIKVNKGEKLIAGETLLAAAKE